MHPFWEKVEHYNSKLIIPAVVLLLFVIIFELFLHIENHILELLVHIADYLIIAVFVIDLVFLGIRSKNTRFFFKNYWLDLLAVFPFVFLSKIIRLFTTKGFVVGQAIAHETIEVGKASSKLGKLTKFSRFLRIGARIIRILTKSRLFTIFGRKKKKLIILKKRNQKKRLRKRNRIKK